MPGLGGAPDWIKRINRQLTDAKKDNDFIYHERIPDVKSLPSLGRAAVVKPTPLPDTFHPDQEDLFSALMPVHIHQALAAYEVRKQELVGVELKKLKEGTNLLNELLNSMSLPAALEDTTGGGVPASLQEKSAAVVAAGGLEELNRLVRELPELLQRNTELLTEAERMLREERESDDSLRKQHGNNRTLAIMCVMFDSLSPTGPNVWLCCRGPLEQDGLRQADGNFHPERGQVPDDHQQRDPG